MRFVTYRAGGREAYGLQTEKGVVDLARRFGERASTLQALIEADLLSVAGKYASEAADHDFGSIEYLPVIPRPMHLWCLALNYVEHHAEVESAGRVQELPKKPALFLRAADSMVGHGQDLVAPHVSEQFDYEGELAVIIGKGGRYISEADAMDHVAGYSVFNDGSIRDWQFHTKQITPGKNFWHTAALGPALVTADEVGDPDNLSIRTTLNGQVVQDGNSRDMLFKIPAFIAYASTVARLEPGDTVEIEIEKVGKLANTVVADR